MIASQHAASVQLRKLREAKAVRCGRGGLCHRGLEFACISSIRQRKVVQREDSSVMQMVHVSKR